MREINLTQGKVALVDDDEYDKMSGYGWYAYSKNGRHWYARKKVKVNGVWQTIHMHRVLMGVVDKSVVVDHRDGNGLNNQKENLRIATSSENTANSVKRPGSKSAHRGLTWHKGKWNVTVGKNRKVIHVGVYEDELLAAKEYNRVASSIHGEFAKLNAV